MERRQLTFTDFDAVLADLHQLQRNGYRKAGAWDLAQVCDHLGYFIQGSLEGFTFEVPWLIKTLFGRLVLWRILKTRQMKAGVTTPQKPLPTAGGDEPTAVIRLQLRLEQLRNHAGELHASPFFGHLTPQQWRDLHVIHCAHHLSFLIPNAAAT
jgi:hypothetical protein